MISYRFRVFENFTDLNLERMLFVRIVFGNIYIEGLEKKSPFGKNLYSVCQFERVSCMWNKYKNDLYFNGRGESNIVRWNRNLPATKPQFNACDLIIKSIVPTHWVLGTNAKLTYVNSISKISVLFFFFKNSVQMIFFW